MKLSARQYHILLFFVSLVLFLLSFRFFGEPIRPGLDPSWMFAHNYFFANDIRLGKDVIGTYGPLGFLSYAMPLGSNILLALFFQAIVRISLALALVRLFLWDYPTKPAETIFAGLFVLGLFLLINNGHLSNGIDLIALSSCLVFIAHKHKRPVFLIPALIVTALALLIKFVWGIFGLSFLCVYCLREVTRKKKFLKPVLIVCGFFVLLAAFWLLIYGDFQGLGDYLIGSLQQSHGYSSAMTSLSAEDNPFLIGAGIFTLLILFLAIRKEPDSVFLFLLFFPGLIMAFKYGVTKQPAFLLSYSLLVLFLLAAHGETVARQISVAALMAVFTYLMTLNTHDPKAFSYRFDALEQIEKSLNPRFPLSLIDFQDDKNRLSYLSSFLLEPQKLDGQTLSTIGDSPVDPYPFEISYIAANNLNWRPRPVFQSYFTYTPWLDRKNEAFFLSDRAPKYLLWDADRGDSMRSIDGRYLLNDEPLTILQILSRYTCVKATWQVILFEKRNSPNLRKPQVFSSSGPIAWNSWVNVPYIDGGIVRGRLQYDHTVFGQMRRTFYRDSPVFIEYLFDSNEVLRCRLVLDNAVSGIWVNPFVVSLIGPNSSRRVVAMRIINPDAENGSYTLQFSVLWEFSAFNGPPDPFLRSERLN